MCRLSPSAAFLSPEISQKRGKMTFDEYWWQVIQDCPSSQRGGQYAFNLLCEVNPVLAEKVRGSLNDPFYYGIVGVGEQRDINRTGRQEKIHKFKEFARANWDL